MKIAAIVVVLFTVAIGPLLGQGRQGPDADRPTALPPVPGLTFGPVVPFGSDSSLPGGLPPDELQRRQKTNRAMGPPAAEPRLLFNGSSLDSWQPVDGIGFRFENGVIRTQAGRGILVYTREKIANAVIRVVYKASGPGGNAGVLIRIPEEPAGESYSINRGLEVQIDDDADDDWHCTGVLHSITKAKARPPKPAGEWNTMEIVMDGPRTMVRVNGALVTDYDGISPVPPEAKSYSPERGRRPDQGHIALRNHDDRATVYFKEISLIPLPKPMM